MSFFDQAYDEMSWQEVCYRLPGELAVNALKRRVNNLDTVKMLFENAGSHAEVVRVLKPHVNNILSKATVDELFATFDGELRKTMFNWMTQENINKFKSCDPNKLDLKFLFNITDSKDQSGLNNIMDKVLVEPTFSSAHLRSVLTKADPSCLASLFDKVLKDQRSEVRACVLSVPGNIGSGSLSDLQKIIGLKAFAKCQTLKPIPTVNILNINLFSNLKPLERINAIEKYLSYFPLYKKVKAFDPAPSDEEFELILFAGCIEYNDKTVKIKELYNKITKENKPEKDDEGQ